MGWEEGGREGRRDRRGCRTGCNRSGVGVDAARRVEVRLPREPRKMEINYIYT